jgi:hypothetical protein
MAILKLLLFIMALTIVHSSPFNLKRFESRLPALLERELHSPKLTPAMCDQHSTGRRLLGLLASSEAAPSHLRGVALTDSVVDSAKSDIVAAFGKTPLCFLVWKTSTLQSGGRSSKYYVYETLSNRFVGYVIHSMNGVLTDKNKVEAENLEEVISRLGLQVSYDPRKIPEWTAQLPSKTASTALKTSISQTGLPYTRGLLVFYSTLTSDTGLRQSCVVFRYAGKYHLLMLEDMGDQKYAVKKNVENGASLVDMVLAEGVTLPAEFVESTESSKDTMDMISYNRTIAQWSISIRNVLLKTKYQPRGLMVYRESIIHGSGWEKHNFIYRMYACDALPESLQYEYFYINLVNGAVVDNKTISAISSSAIDFGKENNIQIYEGYVEPPKDGSTDIVWKSMSVSDGLDPNVSPFNSRGLQRFLPGNHIVFSSRGDPVKQCQLSIYQNDDVFYAYLSEYSHITRKTRLVTWKSANSLIELKTIGRMRTDGFDRSYYNNANNVQAWVNVDYNKGVHSKGPYNTHERVVLDSLFMNLQNSNFNYNNKELKVIEHISVDYKDKRIIAVKLAVTNFYKNFDVIKNYYIIYFLAYPLSKKTSTELLTYGDISLFSSIFVNEYNPITNTNEFPNVLALEPQLLDFTSKLTFRPEDLTPTVPLGCSYFIPSLNIFNNLFISDFYNLKDYFDSMVSLIVCSQGITDDFGNRKLLSENKVVVYRQANIYYCHRKFRDYKDAGMYGGGEVTSFQGENADFEKCLLSVEFKTTTSYLALMKEYPNGIPLIKF